MYALLLSLLLLSTPTPGDTLVDRCDLFYESLDSPATQASSTAWRQYFENAREVRRCYGDRRPDRAIELHSDEVLALRRANQMPQAIEHIDAFLERFSERPDSSTFQLMYQRRGFYHYTLGNLPEAARSYTHTLAYSATEPPTAQARLALDIYAVFHRMRDYDSAWQYTEQALDLLEEGDTPDEEVRTLTSRAYSSQAMLLWEQASPQSPTFREEMREAIQLWERAYDLIPKDESPGQYISALVELGQAYGGLEKFDTALQYYDEARQRAIQENNEYHHFRVTYRLGRLYLMKGEYDEAERLLTKAQDQMETAIQAGDDRFHSEHQRRLFRDFGFLFQLREDDWGRAESYFREAIDVIEDNRSSLRATDWSAAAFGQWQGPYRGLMNVLLAQDRPEEAFITLESTRARHLQDLRIQGQISNVLPSDERARFDSLTSELVSVRNQLAQASDAERGDLVAAETRFEAERRAVLDLNIEPEMPSLEEIQEILAEQNQVLISYFTHTPAPRFDFEIESQAFVVTSDTLQVVPLDTDKAEIEELLTGVSPLLTDDAAEAGIDASHFDLQTLHDLYKAVYAPLEDHLPDDKSLVVVPDGPLYWLPFEALVTEPTGAYAYDEARYLAQERPIAMELGAPLLVDPSEETVGKRFDHEIAAFGMSTFDDAPELPPALRPASVSGRDASGNASLDALPGVNRELDALESLFREPCIFRDESATEESIYDLQGEAQILHLASHALLHPSSPLHHSFVFAPGANSDGLLQMHELQQHPHDIPLVVLSGCSTTRGDLHTGEGLEGLQYAFRASGAQSTLSNLWPSDDDAAVRLSTAFYQHLQDGASKDIALQQAQLEYIEEQPNPFYWAAPTLYGDIEPLALEKPTRVPVLPLAMGGLIVLVAFGFIYIRYARRSPSHA